MKCLAVIGTLYFLQRLYLIGGLLEPKQTVSVNITVQGEMVNPTV